jgi:hypothetical protein
LLVGASFIDALATTPRDHAGRKVGLPETKWLVRNAASGELH